MQYNTALRFLDYFSDPSKIATLKTSNRGNVLKALVSLSKFLGQYDSFTKSIKASGIHWASRNGFDSFLKIINANSHTEVKEWYRKTQTVLPQNEKLFVKFTLLSGLRATESRKAFNRIIELAEEGRLTEYYDSKQQILKHYIFKDSFRHTKNNYISIISRGLINEIVNSKQISYYVIRKHLVKNKLNLELKPLRSLYATFLRNKGIMAEWVDLIQGRISTNNVQLQNYLKLDLTNISEKILPIVKALDLETSN